MSAIKFVEQKSLEGFLNSYKRFSIPAFQRPYSWLPKNISSLWENITTAPPHYYIGTIVAIPTRDSTGLEIIDGQQRITTLLLTFVAMRDHIKKDNRFLKSAEKISGLEKYLWDAEDFTTNKYPRLKFNKKNLGDIFENLLKGEDLPEDEDIDDNQRRLIKNYSLLRKQIKEFYKNSKNVESDFIDLTTKLKELEFIVIICNSDSDAFQLFEGLNSTGLDLSVVDLLKNAVLKAVDEKSKKSEELLSEAEELWSAMEAMFEEKDFKLFSRFIRHQWIARRGYISNSKLFDEIKKKELQVASARDVIKYVRELKEDAQTYLAIRQVSDVSKINKKISRGASIEQIKRDLTVLKALNVEQVYEVLLSLFRKFTSDKGYTPTQFLGNVRSLVNFAFKTRFLTISPASYENIFADFCKDVTDYSGKDLHDKSQKFFKKLSDLVDGEEQKKEFIESFASDLKYSKKDNALINYILTQVYLHSNPTIKINEETIDHFIPQTPDEWGLRKEEIQSFVHNIGNLALLNRVENMQLQNSALDKKLKAVYERSDFVENKVVLVSMRDRFAEAPEAAVQERGQYLGGKAFDLLRIK